jgi:hypothetical protein
MSIAVRCHCGKTFKAKDKLAGKTVRCPACKEPLRIPGGKKKGAKGHPANKEEAALLRFERAQEKKQRSAEDEAVYREEQNKLIESYDAQAGKKGKGKGKGGPRELAGTKKRKVTIFTILADAWGTIKANLFFRYLFIALVLGAGSIGSVYLVRYIATYAEEETAGPVKSREERVDDLFKEAEEAIAAKHWSAARDALDKIIELDPRKAVNRQYKAMRKKLEEEFAKQ